MADPVTTDTTNKTTDAGNQSGITLEQVEAQLGALTSSINEITSKLNQVSNSLNSQSVNENRTLDTELAGADDIYDGKRRGDARLNRLDVIAERSLNLAIERDHLASLRAHDHFAYSAPPATAKA